MNILRTLAAGIAALAFGSMALAQTPPYQPANGARPPVQQTSATVPATAPPAAPGTRVAVLNINKVLKGYNRAQQLNSSISGKFEEYSKQINAKRDEITKLQVEASKAVSQEQRDAFERRGLDMQRQIQDMDAQARKEIGAQQAQIATAVFKEIEGVVQAVAVANGFQLVMSYPDATTETEMYSQQNIMRKMTTQAAIPLFVTPQIDISDAVVQTLNSRYPAPAPTNPITPGAAAPAAPR